MVTALSMLETENTLGRMNEMQRFGKLIEDGMKERGLVGYQFAAMLGKQQSWLSRILNGQNANPPTPEDMRALSQTLGIPVRAMLEALGYLEPTELEPQIAYIIERDDPRAEILAMLEGASPAKLDTISQLVRVLTDALPGR